MVIVQHTFRRTQPLGRGFPAATGEPAILVALRRESISTLSISDIDSQDLAILELGEGLHLGRDRVRRVPKHLGGVISAPL